MLAVNTLSTLGIIRGGTACGGVTQRSVVTFSEAGAVKLAARCEFRGQLFLYEEALVAAGNYETPFPED